ncbi:NlpC/P60 family protein, partial [Solirubrobacter phytolaccae]
PASDDIPAAPSGAAGGKGAAAAADGAASGNGKQSEGLAGAAKRFARRFTGGGSASAAPADNSLPAAGAPVDASLPGAPVDNALPASPAAAAENSLPATPDENSLPGASADGLPTAPVEPPTPQALALLANKNLVLDPGAIAALQAGGTDPRLVGVLTTLGAGHQLTVSGDFAGGTVDITKVDGELVNPDSAAARELAGALAALDPSVRPDEVGTPWPISSPGFITNSAHQDQLRLTFKAPVELPASAIAPPVAAAVPAQPAVAAAVPVAPVQPAVPAEPAYDPSKSNAFLSAVKASAASTREPERSDSQAFLQAVVKKEPKAAAAQFASQPAAPGVAEVAAAAPGAYPGDTAPKDQIAAWMAAEAEKRGLPPELPVMAGLVESGLKNLNYGDADSLGFFQMRVSIWDSGPYKGFSSDPAKQLDWFFDEASKVKEARVAAGKPIDDPQHYGEWIADTERPAAQYRYRYQTKLAEAKGLLANRSAQPAAAAAVPVSAPVAAPGGGGSLGVSALSVAKGQLGVREVGTNAGPQVDQYLKSAGVAPGNPWCASFITWALEQTGHKMPGGGWAAVQTWVRNAEQGANGLQIVSAADARPGDIVAYDWGGQSDFGADGHIGFLDSTVQDGKFTALEGNNADAVSSVPRTTGSGNVVFIRVNGDAPAGVPVQPAPAPNAAASPPIDPKQFGGDEVGTGGAANAEALAALNNPNLVFDDVGKADIKAGRIDPRVIGVLTKLSQEHKITVSCMCSDHSKFTAGGSVSNHFFGRGVDIAAIDGETVGPGSPLAREIASEVSTLDANIRPNEIGSPFAIGGPGYFTDAAHQNHIHLGFKQEITADWKAPADVAAQPAAVAGAPAQFAAAPGTPVVTAAATPAEPAFDPRRSDAFLPAVNKASAASADRELERSDSQAFLPVVEKPPVAQAAQAPAPAAPIVAQPAAAQPAVGAPAVDVSAAVDAAPTTYPGDSAPKEQIAAWMAAQAKERGLPPQLPIMAGLVESGLQNLNHGHADSVGFFQMRVGIWNQGAYAGYPDKPELQMKWFLDQAEAVKKQRIVAGKPIDDPNSFGEWIADVERPAEQYRGRYQTKLAEANGLLGAQPQPAAAVAQPVSAPVDPAAAAAAVGSAQLPPEIAAPLQQAIASGNGPGPKALAAITEASKYMGTDYKWGGSTPQTGFDCSGLMQWSYAQSGVQIPRVTYTQIEAPNGVEVADRSQLKPGDLVFFAANGDVHHVGMFLGGDQFLHAPSTGDVVKVSSLSEPYYAGQFAGGRRFDAGAPAAVAPVAAAQPAQFAAAQPAAIDPTEVAKAQAAVARDAAEVRRNDSQLFMAISRAEASKAAAEEKHASQMFLKAVDPSQVTRRRALAAEPPAAPATPAAVPATPAAAPPVAQKSGR